jgi:hypothetical protein
VIKTTIARKVKSGISETIMEEQCSEVDNFSGTYSYYMTLPGEDIEKGIVQVQKIKKYTKLFGNVLMVLNIMI